MTTPDERESLFRDLVREMATSWIRMPLWAQIVLAAATIVWIAAAFVPIPASAHILGASVRVASFIALIVGLFENAKTLDASAISLVSSGIVLFALTEFGTDLKSSAVFVLWGTFFLGFFISFARLRRA